MNSNSYIPLPKSMSKLRNLEDWTPKLKSALARSLQSSSPVVITDFVESWTGTVPPQDDLSEFIARQLSPSAAYDGFLVCQEWFEIVSLPKLSDVIGDQRDWTWLLRAELEQWLMANGSIAEMHQIALKLGNADVLTMLRRSTFDYAADIGLAMADYVSPQELRQAALATPRQTLPITEAYELAELDRNAIRGRRGVPPADASALKRLAERLTLLRARGVPVTELARVTYLSKPRIYQLTKT